MKSVGGSRFGFGSLLVALVVAGSGLVAVGSADPAAAAEVYPCTETARAGDYLPLRPSRDGMDVVSAVSLSIYIGNAGFEERRLSIRSETNQGPLYGTPFAVIEQNAASGDYVFTSQGGNSIARADRPGTYVAGALFSAFDRYPGGTRVEVLEGNDQFPRPVPSWTLKVTFLNCDSDGDSRTDRADNCPTVANIDQADLDKDGAGDACDPDADGDNAADTSDNCLRLANNQLDSDGDGAGDACDATPYPPAPIPTPSPTGSPTTGPTGPGVPGPDSSPTGTVARTLTMKYVKKKRVFSGRVVSETGSCASYAEVTLWRKSQRADRRLVISTSNETGRFRTPRVKRKGKYFVTVAASPDGACGAARSKALRIRRR